MVEKNEMNSSSGEETERKWSCVSRAGKWREGRELEDIERRL
jgi:hypothetical protein